MFKLTDNKVCTIYAQKVYVSGPMGGRLDYAEICAKLDSNPIPLRIDKTVWILDHLMCKRPEFNQAANNRCGNSPRFSIRKIFQLNPELGQTCSEITNKMFKRTKHP